jgi:hypothetical protein
MAAFTLPQTVGQGSAEATRPRCSAIRNAVGAVNPLRVGSFEANQGVGRPFLAAGPFHETKQIDIVGQPLRTGRLPG